MADEKSLGYSFNFPIKTPEDVQKLKKRAISVNRNKTALIKEMLEDVVGDIMPIKVGNIDPFVFDYDSSEYSDCGFGGNFFFGLTWQLYRFLGNDSLLYWVYDHPETIHEMMQYLRDDKIALFQYLENEALKDIVTKKF